MDPAVSGDAAAHTGRVGAGGAPRVFVNYRREDAAGHAGRLYDSLAERLGKDHVFMDVDAIRPGADYTKVIEGAVGSCDVLLVLIGRSWLSASGSHGRRLDDPGDLVRLEIEAALTRDILVLPVLVQGAAMPSAEQLPQTLAALARRNALELSDSRWDFDVGRILSALDVDATDGAVHGARAAAPAPERSAVRRIARSRLLIGAGIAAALAAIIAIVALGGGGSSARTLKVDRVFSYSYPSGWVTQGLTLNIAVPSAYAGLDRDDYVAAVLQDLPTFRGLVAKAGAHTTESQESHAGIAMTVLRFAGSDTVSQSPFAAVFYFFSIRTQPWSIQCMSSPAHEVQAQAACARALETIRIT